MKPRTRTVDGVTWTHAERIGMACVDPAGTLKALRWQADMIITNDSGEQVWLKPCVVRGKRIGITDCCRVDDPCEHHAAMRAAAKEKR